jgi:DNA segregation ATPase FtsK/SpoIIIE-like protein
MLFVAGFVAGALATLVLVAGLRLRSRERSRTSKTSLREEESSEQEARESEPAVAPGFPPLDPALANLLRHASSPPNDTRDPERLLFLGLRVFAETGGVSTLVLQRRLSLDFAQATILIEEMERRGYVSPRHDQRPRRLLPPAYEFVRDRNEE